MSGTTISGAHEPEWLAAQAGHVVASDVSNAMLARVQERLDSESVTLVTESWPLETGRFDAVMATLVPGHVEVLGPVYRKARRVVQDGGTFYLAELHPDHQFVGTWAHIEGETVVIDALTHPGVRE